MFISYSFDLQSIARFQEREKNPWSSITFSKVAGFARSNTPPWMFLTFFKLYKCYQIAQNILCHVASSPT